MSCRRSHAFIFFYFFPNQCSLRYKHLLVSPSSMLTTPPSRCLCPRPLKTFPLFPTLCYSRHALFEPKEPSTECFTPQLSPTICPLLSHPPRDSSNLKKEKAQRSTVSRKHKKERTEQCLMLRCLMLRCQMLRCQMLSRSRARPH